MKVYVVRHAETNYNLLDLANDSPEIDVYLTPKGIAQAEELAKTLESIKFDLVITSDFPRTKRTARIVNQLHNAPTVADSRINDLLTGFEGRPVAEFRQARQSAENRWTARFNGGESFEDTKARVNAFLDDLRNRTEDTVLVVTHQGIARIIYASIHGIPNEEAINLEVSNTHCFEFEF